MLLFNVNERIFLEANVAGYTRENDYQRKWGKK